jgi:transcriptional regulator with XRE-family HTH domain
VPTSGSPTVRRRRLAAELRRLRENAGRTGDDVAAALEWSPSKVSRYELARTGLKPTEVGKLLDYYEVTGSRRDQLLALAREATQKGWWEDYTDVVSEEYLAFIGLEAEASSVEQWHVEVVPGLLQTVDYARQVHLGFQRVSPIPPSTIERRVQLRLARQEALTAREPPLELSVVIDESILLRQIGDHSVMRAQLERLAEAANLPNITLRVLPLRGDHALVVDSFVIFRFGQDHETPGSSLHDVVSTEHLVSELYVEGETDTYLHRLAFDSLVKESLSPSDSRELLVRTAKSWR